MNCSICKLLIIALLCYSLFYPFCIAMEKDSEIENKEVATLNSQYDSIKSNLGMEHRNPKSHYKDALSHLRSILLAPNDPVADFFFHNLIESLSLAVEKSYSPAVNLLSVLNSLESLEVAKETLKLSGHFANMGFPLNDKDKYCVFFTQIYYTVKRFDDGIKYFLPLLEKNYDGTEDLLFNIFKTSPDAVSHFDKNLDLIFLELHENKEKIQSTFLDVLCKLKDITNHLNPTVLEEISARYWRVFCILDRKKEYLEQAILYSLLSAKNGNDPLAVARGRLVTILNTNDPNVHDIYYSYMIPFLQANDQQAEVLFNEIAHASPGAARWFDEYAAGQLKIGNNPTLSETMNRTVMNRTGNGHLALRKKGTSELITFPNPDFDYFAGETPVVAVFAGLTPQEENMSPKELYMFAMKHMGRDNDKTLNALLRAAEGKNKDAIRKINNYRKSHIYKEGDKTKKTDSIEHLLYQRDKSNRDLVTPEKKESKIASPSAQTPTSSPVISSKEKQPRPKNTQKEEDEKITIRAMSTSTSSKKERRLQKSKPLDNSRNIDKPIDENAPPSTMQSEIVSTPVLETPQTKLEVLKLDTVPVIQEIKPISAINIASGQFPTESQEVSRNLEEIIESPKAIPERKIRKTLSRTNSLTTIEKPIKNDETSKRKTIHRTQSLISLKPASQDSDIMSMEEPKRKKKKEHSTKISLKKFLPTHKLEKKLERQKSQSSLLELDSETPQVNSQSNSKSSGSFKKLTRSLSDRDLKCKSNVPLTEAVITSTLNEFKEQGVVDWTRNGNTISATKKDDPNVHITIHTHDKSDKSWSERPEIRADFLEFSSECDDDLKETISEIGKKKPAKK